MNTAIRHVQLDNDAIAIGRYFSVNFQRTLRLPDDGRDYPLPPGFGRFDLRAVADFATRVPAAWREAGGFLLPMYRHEALWLSFECPSWHPVAVRVEAGSVCAVTGVADAGALCGDPQNYMVAPMQPWLDGIKAGEGIIRQFVAAPIGDGVTIEAQVTGAELTGGIRITIVEPKAGRFHAEEPPTERYGWAGLGGPDESDSISACMSVCESSAEMGLGAGGRMVQKIYPDDLGLDTWEADSATSVHIHLVDVRDWRSITGEEPPPSPISVETYKSMHLPWFELADQGLADLPVSSALAKVKPIAFY